MVWRLAYLLLTQPCCRKWDYGPKSLVMNSLGINLQGPHSPFMIVAFSAVGWQSHEMLTPIQNGKKNYGFYSRLAQAGTGLSESIMVRGDASLGDLTHDKLSPLQQRTLSKYLHTVLRCHTAKAHTRG